MDDVDSGTSVGSWKERLFALLRDVSDACARDGVSLLLYGDTALAAYRDGVLSDNVDVCIDAAQAERFEAAMRGLESSGHVFLDSMLETPTFPYFGYRVTDVDTIDFDAAMVHRYRYCGLGIRVHVVCHPHDPSKFARATAAFNRHVKDLAAGKKRPSKRLVRLLGPRALLSQRTLPHSVFRHFVKRGSAGGGGAVVDDVLFSSDIFKCRNRVCVDGVEFEMPQDAEAFFGSLFGADWEKREVPCFKEGEWAFRDGAHPWGEFEPRISHIDFKALAKLRSENTRVYRKRKKVDATRSSYVHYLNRTHSYFLLKVEYEGKAPYLRQLLDANELDELGRELHDYLEKARACSRVGLGLCFDDEVFAILLDYLRRTGDDACASELEAVKLAEESRTTKFAEQGGIE